MKVSTLCILPALYILSIVGSEGEGSRQVAITQKNGIVTFWFNSSNTHVAVFTFDYCHIVYCPSIYRQCDMYRDDTPRSRSIYICVTDDYWGSNCNYWGAVGWNTGTDWGYRPQSALDKNGKSLLSRMTLTKTGKCQIDGSRGHSMRLTLTIENPSPTDAGTYVLGAWVAGKRGGQTGKFLIKDMYESPNWRTVPRPNPNPLKPHVTTLNDMIAMADPTFEDTMAAETGYSDTNFWLEWMKFSATQHNKSNCYVCGGARPHLGTVPLQIPKESEECFLSLYTNITTDHSACGKWGREYPIVLKSSKPNEDITIYPGNYTCYANYQGRGRFLGNFTEGYCTAYSSVPKNQTQYQVQSLGDIYWICGDRKIRTRLSGAWTGECAPAKAIMPLHIMTEGDTPDVQPAVLPGHRRRRAIPGSFDPHVYIDTIGVPRGVPDEFKARDQVKAGFESLIPMITVNKNVGWINYIYYNQQRFVNYTRDALQGIADQLTPTTYMTFQNRMPLDMILAEKGGVCKMIEKTGTCCTYIPDNTGPNGKVTQAIQKLQNLSEELKKNSGVVDPWDQYFNWLGGWRKALVQFGMTVLLILILFALVVCCVLP